MKTEYEERIRKLEAENARLKADRDEAYRLLKLSDASYDAQGKQLLEAQNRIKKLEAEVEMSNTNHLCIRCANNREGCCPSQDVIACGDFKENDAE